MSDPAARGDRRARTGYGAPMKSIRRLGATLGLATALLVSSAGVASAQRWTIADPAGDVVKVTETGTSYAASQAQGDVVQTTVSHTRTKVVIRVRMRAVPRGNWGAVAVVRTPRASFDLLQLKLGDDRDFTLSRGGTDKELRCAGKSARIDRTAVVLTVPRTCLGRPGKVRAGAGIAILETDGETETTYQDDALRRTVGENLRLSPWIKRG